MVRAEREVTRLGGETGAWGATEVKGEEGEKAGLMSVKAGLGGERAAGGDSLFVSSIFITPGDKGR